MGDWQKGRASRYLAVVSDDALADALARYRRTGSEEDKARVERARRDADLSWARVDNAREKGE